MNKQKQKNRNKAFPLRGRMPWLYIAPAAAGFVLFYAFPMLYSLVYLFFEPDGSGRFRFVNSFSRLFASSAFSMAVKNTAVIFIIFIPAVVLVSLSIAYFIFIMGKKYFRIGKVILDTILIPYLIPSCVAVTFWFYMFNSKGFINRIINILTSVAGLDWKSGYSCFFAMFLLFIWKYSGLNIIILTAAFSYVPLETIESAKIDGASGVSLFLRVIIPQIKKQLFFVVVLSVVGVFSFSNEIYAVFGLYPPQVLYTLQNYIGNTFLKMEFYKSVAASVVFAVFTGICAYLYVRAEKRWNN